MRARVPKNMGGNAQNMNSMIRQAQKMQDQITDLQDDIEAREFNATAGGGAVEVTVTGKKELFISNKIANVLVKSPEFSRKNCFIP